MNEFIEQFLVEARELVAQATSDLLALEQRPDDPERIDSVFRAFHTLKGAAGIVEFEPMGRALHAAESVLAEFRSKANSISPAIIDECLACLDQVTRWLDDMEVDRRDARRCGRRRRRHRAAFRSSDCDRGGREFGAG